MCVDCVLASPRIAEVDPGDEPLFEVVMSHFLKLPYLSAQSWHRINVIKQNPIHGGCKVLAFA
jgi:hypothetical protein